MMAAFFITTQSLFDQEPVEKGVLHVLPSTHLNDDHVVTFFYDCWFFSRPYDTPFNLSETLVYFALFPSAMREIYNSHGLVL